MKILRCSKPGRILGNRKRASDSRHPTALRLDGSKSVSNRALIIRALAGTDPAEGLFNLSTSTDTATLLRLLTPAPPHPITHYDAGDAGTTFRFLTAYLALQPGTHVLTGSPRMLQRPIGPLVEALRTLGFDIRYLGQSGYPPIEIRHANDRSAGGRVSVDAGVSSQFLSALLLIGPYLPEGLELLPVGGQVSRPYLDMTVHLMRYFGAAVEQRADGAMVVQPGIYTPRRLSVEADWSAASYWYAVCALADEADLILHGLSAHSWQGDSAVAGMMTAFGVATEFLENEHAVCLRKSGRVALPDVFEQNFRDCPDLAPTFVVVCAGLGVPGVFSGLETLAIKETDRCAALRTELAKVGVTFEPDEQQPGTFRLHGKAAWQTPPRFATYDDHRIAMALAPLVLLGPIEIENPEVVRKSYPDFWEHLHLLITEDSPAAGGTE